MYAEEVDWCQRVHAAGWESPMSSTVLSKPVTPPADLLVGRTLASDVLFRLREDILGSHFLPGEPLRFELLRERYRASFSTLREALAHLVQEGMVAAEGQRGFRVAPVSRADLQDLLEIRVLVEREALRLSIQHGAAPWRDGVAAAFQRMDLARLRAEAAGHWTSAEWHREHRGFHDALVAGCGSATLLDIRGLLWQRQERYRTLAWRLRPEERGPVSDHRDILDAALAQDARRVRSLVESQIRRFGDRVLRHAAELLTAN
jgi:DNA-binding GntR family transcriptional regulator